MTIFKKNYGFSLIELMIVLSIIGILAVIAVPSYQKYTKRARFSEVIGATEVFKIAVALALQEGMPIEELSNGNHGIPETVKVTKHLAKIEVSQGVITATGTHLVDDATYILEPINDGSEWKVQGTCLLKELCHAS